MLVISTCDADTDWTTDGGSLSIDTEDKKEGTGSLKNTVAESEIGTWYSTIYNPTGSWDWSAKKHILGWVKSDRASTEFTEAHLRITDLSGALRDWYLTFSAGEWTAFKLLLSTGDVDHLTINLAEIAEVRVFLQAADTDAFYKKIDYVRVIVGSQGMIGDDYFMRL